MIKPVKTEASYHFAVVSAEPKLTAFSEISGNFLIKNSVFMFSVKSVIPTMNGSQ